MPYNDSKFGVDFMARAYDAVEAAKPAVEAAKPAVQAAKPAADSGLRAYDGRRAGDSTKAAKKGKARRKEQLNSDTKLAKSSSGLIDSVLKDPSPFVFEIVIEGKVNVADEEDSGLKIEAEANGFLGFFLETIKNVDTLGKEIELSESLYDDVENLISKYVNKITNGHKAFKELKKMCSLFNSEKYGEGVLKIAELFVCFTNGIKEFASVTSLKVSLRNASFMAESVGEEEVGISDLAAAAGGGGSGGAVEVESQEPASSASTVELSKEKKQEIQKWLGEYVRSIMENSKECGSSEEVSGEKLLYAYRTALISINIGITDIEESNKECAEEILRKLIRINTNTLDIRSSSR